MINEKLTIHIGHVALLTCKQSLELSSKEIRAILCVYIFNYNLSK